MNNPLVKHHQPFPIDSLNENKTNVNRVYSASLLFGIKEKRDEDLKYAYSYFILSCGIVLKIEWNCYIGIERMKYSV